MVAITRIYGLYQIKKLLFFTLSITGQGVYLDHNKSERYESRFVTVSVKSSNAIMFQGMEDSVLGVWVSHGEGKLIWFCFIIILSVVSNDCAD